MNENQSNNILSNRNNNLDLLKAIAAYFVVTIHCSLPTPVGEIVNTIARTAVPMFFIISGYYLSYPSHTKEYNIEKIQSKIMHISKLCLIAYILYFFLSMFLIDDMTITQWFLYQFKLKNIIKIILFNEINVSSHLWFLFALLNAYLLYLLFYKLNLIKLSYKLTPILLIILLILSKHNIEIFQINIPIFCTRNFLFFAFPFLMIGHFIRNNKYFNEIQINKTHIICVIICFLLVSIVERFTFGMHELYVGTLIDTIAIFLFSVKSFTLVSSNNKLVFIGKKYSLSIYIIHYFIVKISSKALTFYNLDKNLIIQYLAPILICIITTILAVIFYYFKNKLTSKIKSL